MNSGGVGGFAGGIGPQGSDAAGEQENDDFSREFERESEADFNALFEIGPEPGPSTHVQQSPAHPEEGSSAAIVSSHTGVESEETVLRGHADEFEPPRATENTMDQELAQELFGRSPSPLSLPGHANVPSLPSSRNLPQRSSVRSSPYPTQPRTSRRVPASETQAPAGGTSTAGSSTQRGSKTRSRPTGSNYPDPDEIPHFSAKRMGGFEKQVATKAAQRTAGSFSKTQTPTASGPSTASTSAPDGNMAQYRPGIYYRDRSASSTTQAPAGDSGPSTASTPTRGENKDQSRPGIYYRDPDPDEIPHFSAKQMDGFNKQVAARAAKRAAGSSSTTQTPTASGPSIASTSTHGENMDQYRPGIYYRDRDPDEIPHFSAKQIDGFEKQVPTRAAKRAAGASSTTQTPTASGPPTASTSTPGGNMTQYRPGIYYRDRSAGAEHFNALAGPSQPRATQTPAQEARVFQQEGLEQGLDRERPLAQGAREETPRVHSAAPSAEPHSAAGSQLHPILVTSGDAIRHQHFVNRMTVPEITSIFNQLRRPGQPSITEPEVQNFLDRSRSNN